MCQQAQLEPKTKAKRTQRGHAKFLFIADNCTKFCFFLLLFLLLLFCYCELNSFLCCLQRFVLSFYGH